MTWKIGHFETEADGTIHVTRLDWIEPEQKDDKGKVTKRETRKAHQLTTAIAIPAKGAARGLAIAALKQVAKDIRKEADTPDTSDIETALNEGNDE